MKPRSSSSRWFSVRVTEARGPEGDVHIAVSKRVAPLSTRRNRMKRLVREALRRNAWTKPGMVYWIRVEKAPPDADYQQVADALMRVLS